ncbi:MAG: alpha-glucosidase [Selenomonadaceae bacterium]|nr:alpha-glucosidase [Selenomonadaceae bacterium]
MNRRDFIKGTLTLATAAAINPSNLFFVRADAAGNNSWWQKKSVYQVYPKSFMDTNGDGIGDLRGIINKLDYIQSLGVGAIWLTPIYSSPMADNGYDISDYTAINPTFGTMADFEELVAEADKRGMKIVMDLVFNHSSDKHPWFLESKTSRDNPKADWYIWREGINDNPPTNWQSIFGGSAWEWNDDRGQYYLHTFSRYQPDLNWENPEVRRALYDAANFWLDKGVGGFRIDAIVYIKKPEGFTDGATDSEGNCSIHNMTANQPGILDFLQEFKREVFDGHDIFTVAEANAVKPKDLPQWVGDKGVFDMLFEFSHVNVIFPEGEIWHKAADFNLVEFKKALSASQNATRNSWYPIYFENHDRPRSIDIFFPEDADKKLAAKALATILFTLRGTPFIYQGEELGFGNADADGFRNINDYDDISSIGQYELGYHAGLSEEENMKIIRKYSRDNARTPMQWDASKNAGFSVGKPWLPIHKDYKTCNAAEEDLDQESVLIYYRHLSAMRNESEVLINGDYKEYFSDNEEIYVYTRALGDKKIGVAVNFTTHDVKLPFNIFGGCTKINGNYHGEEYFLRPTEAIIYEFNN